MAYGDKCTHCGRCCKTIPCGIGLALLGDHRPCKALEEIDGKYYCGLVLHANKYIDLGENVGWKEEFLKKLFSHMLGIGMGCCICPENELIKNEMREKLTFKNALYKTVEEFERCAIL